MARRAGILLRLMSNLDPRGVEVCSAAGGRTASALSESSSVAQSVRAQLGTEVRGRRRGASQLRRMGMWSEPGDGTGSVHSEKKGTSPGQAKARSRTPGLLTEEGNRGRSPPLHRRKS